MNSINCIPTCCSQMRVAALCAAGLSAVAAAQEPRRVTLAEALQLAQRAQPAMVQARQSLRIAEVSGRPATLRAPGEPFQDLDGNGRFDAGEQWINLRYPPALGGDPVVDASNGLRDDGGTGPMPLRNARGPALGGTLAIDGILYTSGRLDPAAGATHRGSLIAREGVVPSDPAASALEIYWDDTIGSGSWPPPEWNLPRVAVLAWRALP